MHKSYLVGEMTHVPKRELWALKETLSINFDNLKNWYQSRILLCLLLFQYFFRKIDYILIDSNKVCEFRKKMGAAKTWRITRTAPRKSTRTARGASELLLGARVPRKNTRTARGASELLLGVRVYPSLTNP